MGVAMIIKPTEENRNIKELERLLELHPDKGGVILSELRKLRAGQTEENNVAHYLDRECGSSRSSVILHDLRFEYRGQVFQIDHLIINRALIFTLLETKSAKYGLKVDAQGNFFRNWKGHYQGIPSPIEQVQSQQRMLTEYLSGFDFFPKRLGVKLRPVFQSYVTISPRVHFQADPGFDASSVIRYDRIFGDIEKAGAKFSIAGRLMNMVSYETIEEIGANLAQHHIPKDIDWNARLKLSTKVAIDDVPPLKTGLEDVDVLQSASSLHTCVTCSSPDVTIKYGRNYYFACQACGKNFATALPGPGKLRKEGKSFFYVSDRKPEALYHTNP